MEASLAAVALPTAAALALYGTMIVAFAWRMRSRTRRRVEAERAPRVTILKPLAGADDELEANLESFASLDYPAYEVLFGVASMDDPAFEVARRFVARHPRLDSRVVVTDPTAALNPKVAQLVALARAATGDVLVVSDSNVRVRRSYLWPIVAELSDPEVGLVTGIFVGAGERTLGAALENLQLCASSAPGVVAIDALSARPLTVGKSMAVRRRDLVRLGGFARVGRVLAEDHALGRVMLDAGWRVRTVLDPVENRNVACSLARTVERHTRWAQMRRVLTPRAFVLEPLLSPLVTATIVAIVDPSRVAAACLAIALAAQVCGAWIAVRALRREPLGWGALAPLEVLRAYVAFFCWARACATRRVVWRGHAFELRAGTELVPIDRARRAHATARA